MKESYSVSELSQILKAAFDRPEFAHIAVYGEVYSIKLGKFSYIELGDQGNKQTNSPLLKCAFSTFYNNPYHLEEIKVGDVIQIRGKLSYYPHGSSLTLWGEELTLLQSQEGKNLLAKKKTLEKLDKLGYLDEKRKRKIPKYCKKVAVLTAENGAAYQDILKTLKGRFPVSSVLYPVIVQGDNAAYSITVALERANRLDYDCILLGRGGGSKTDLSCFDDEKLALAIANSKIPVVTCIGHTIDTAIADRVADIVAITPTEAASLINPSKEECKKALLDYKEALDERIENYIRSFAYGLNHYKEQLEAYSPLNQIKHKQENNKIFYSRLNESYLSLIRKKKQILSSSSSSLQQGVISFLKKEKIRLQSYSSLLENLSPKTLEKKGYALLYKDGKKVTSAHMLKADDQIEITYSDGRVKAIIKE